MARVRDIILTQTKDFSDTLQCPQTALPREKKYVLTCDFCTRWTECWAPPSRRKEPVLVH